MENIRGKSLIFRVVGAWLIGVFLIAPLSAYAQGAVIVPQAGKLNISLKEYKPAQLVGLKIDKEDPFRFYFVVAKGDVPLSPQEAKADYGKLIRYFLTALTLPNNDMWVNLSPSEPDKVIADNFSQTDMGAQFLEQDLILKQLTASLIISSRLLDSYADKVTLSDRVWISADTADICQKDNGAFLVKSHLKVSLNNDGVVSRMILPEIEQEVNYGTKFAELRRIYNAMILATWFKRELKANLLNRVYSDKSKLAGVTAKDQKAKERIYEEYLQKYRNGVANYIKRDFNPLTRKVTKRTYFSGGILPVQEVRDVTGTPEGTAFFQARASAPTRHEVVVEADLVDADDGAWQRLRDEAAETAGNERFLEPYLKKFIIKSKSLEASLAKILANDLGADKDDAERLEKFILKILEASSDIRAAIRADLLAVLDKDPAAKRLSEPFLYFKGFHALAGYRLAHWLWQKAQLDGQEGSDVALWLQSRISKLYGVDIHPAADIEAGVVFDHGTGIVVGSTAVIGSGTYILHGVTLGSNGKSIGDRHPKVGRNVMIGADASLLGNIKIADGAKIGAGAVVVNDVASGEVYVGPKAKPVTRRGENTAPAAVQAPRALTLDERRDGFDRAVIRHVEKAVARLETRWLNGSGPGDYDGVSVASGVAGGHIALRYALTRSEAPQRPEIVLLRPAYGGTEGNVKLYQSYGYPVKIVSDLSKLDEALNENTAAVIFESPANPSLPVVDIENTVHAVRAKSKNAVVIFDGAFATSLGQQPLKYGVDIVVQVVTKGLSGDGVVFGTVNVAHRKIVDELRKLRTEPISVDDAIRLRRGLANLQVRFARQQANALRYLAYLKSRPEVKFVRYPGDDEHPNRDVAQKQMENPGHMLYFDLGTADKAKAFMSLLRYFRTIEHAVSLGDVRNLMQMPGYGALSNLSDAELAQGGVTRGGIRWSVGIEDPADVERELNAIFTILQLYDGNFDEIPYGELDRIFMQPTTDALGKALYKLRKFPIVVWDGDKFIVEPQIVSEIAQLKTKRAQQAAQAIDAGTRIDLYNPQTLLIHHTGVWGLFSGDHSSLIATDHALSSAYRASDPDDLRGKFGYASDAGKLSVPPTGAYSGYGRFGSPSSETVQILTALAETGAREAFSFKHQGVSTPTFNSALELLLNYWTIDEAAKRQKSGNKAPLRVAVITNNGSPLADFVEKYRQENARRFSLSGGNGVQVDIISPLDNGTFSSSFSEADFVLADEGVWEVKDIPAIKASAPNAQLAWVNTRGIRKGLKPIENGADITLLDIQNDGKSAAGILVIPQKDAEGLFTRRNYNSIATRAGSDILVHQFPYLLLTPNVKAAPKDKGGVDFSEDKLALHLRGSLEGFTLPQNSNSGVKDVRGLVAVISGISAAGI